MENLHDTTAVVLAGGLGTRLRTVVADRSKVVAEVNGRPFLFYIFDQLADAGIRKVILCTGYLAENVRELLGDTYKTLSLTYSVEDKPLGTGGALRLALPLLDSDPILVMNGDSYCDINLAKFAREHSSGSTKASLALTTVPDISRYGAVSINSDKKVCRFEEKGARTGAGLINAGIYLLAQDIISTMPHGESISLERDIFPGLIQDGFHSFTCSGRFIDIGVPADYISAAAFFDTKNNHCEGTP
jgi:NDP-sugar pyrophosphorylase family protein